MGGDGGRGSPVFTYDARERTRNITNDYRLKRTDHSLFSAITRRRERGLGLGSWLVLVLSTWLALEEPSTRSTK